jgi:hypothetical protein
MPRAGGILQRNRDDRVSHGDPDPVVALTSLVVAVGVGPVLPLPLAVAALRMLGQEQSVAHVRDLIVALGVLASRGKPGLPDETFGIAHTEFLRPLEAAVEGSQMVHRWQRTARSYRRSMKLTPVGAATPGITAYARNAAPRHHLAGGDPDGGVDALNGMNTHRTAHNRGRWASWLPAFDEHLRPDHPATLATWRRRGGDIDDHRSV